MNAVVEPRSVEMTRANAVDIETGEIIDDPVVPSGFTVDTIADAAWLLRKRARDEKRVADLRAAMQREIEEETTRIRESYARQLESAERAVGWWMQFDDQLEFLAHAETMDRKDESVAIGSYRIGFRTNPAGVEVREGVVTKTADPQAAVPLFAWCLKHAPAAIKTERSFLISEAKKLKDLDLVKSAPDLFQTKPKVRMFYVEVNGVKHERRATIQPPTEETPAETGAAA